MDIKADTEQASILETAAHVYSNTGFVFRQWQLTLDMRIFALRYGLPDSQVSLYRTQFRDHAAICRKFWDEPHISDGFRQQLMEQNAMDYVVFGAANAVWLSRWTYLEALHAERIVEKQYHCSSDIQAAYCGAQGKIACKLGSPNEDPPP